jgi:hypothetical protein
MPMIPYAPRRAWLGPVLRAGLCGLGLALVAVPILRYQDLRERQEETAQWLHAAGVTQEVALDREPDPERVRLRAARAVLASEIDAATPESAAQLAEAARIAGEILSARPAAWDAAMIQGAATYLGWSRTQDPRLFTRHRSWEAPLEASLELAPGKREPVRFLATAYLEVWPALSPRKKEIARGLLAEVFRRPEDLDRLLEAWLVTAPDLGGALAAVPPEPEAWERVEGALARRGDWRGFSTARTRRNELLLAELRRDLARADRLRRAGNATGARALYLSVAERARPEARFAEVLDAALSRCPPGLVDRRTGSALAPHLARALDRCLLAGCEMEPRALKRLSRFVREAEPHQEAMAALFAGDLPEAERLERRREALRSADWAPYWIAKTRVLAGRGRLEEAREALAEVDLAWRDHPLWWQAERELAQASGNAGSAARAEGRLAELAHTAWPATAWTWRRDRPRLEMLVASAAPGLVLELDEVAENGAVVELRLDGASLGAFPVRRAAGRAGTALAVAAPVRGGLHVLELESLHGGRVLPGAVRLR